MEISFLYKGPPRLDMLGEIPVLAIPTDFQCANFFRKNKPLPLPRVGIQLSVIVKPVNGILFRIRGNPFGLAASKYHLPQLDCFLIGVLKKTFTVSFSIHTLKTFVEIPALYIKHEESDKIIWISRHGISMIVDGERRKAEAACNQGEVLLDNSSEMLIIRTKCFLCLFLYSDLGFKCSAFLGMASRSFWIPDIGKKLVAATLSLS
ncbi:hypothetical protein SLEP1_g12429 [Rubroshorea leprosula]|uniref:Uncharacterized protein n=1 Tax=Rubroshorea leprosula TaxID=152421 RepID=A0AAV5IL48_9ROSI|nr:hypothetical protein SLEP1_g12429 [Rubroshorea leprosula]